MNHIDAFSIDNTYIQLSDTSYTEKYSSVEYTQTTEAGTRRRDTVRTGFLDELSVTLTTTGTIKKKFDDAAKADSVLVGLWSTYYNTSIGWYCYVSDYSASLVRDTATETYWEISVTFKDLIAPEDVEVLESV